jgi:hypothetical protein
MKGGARTGTRPEMLLWHQGQDTQQLSNSGNDVCLYRTF